MHLVTQSISELPTGLEIISVVVDRHKLARRRWRGEGADGADFGFDVSEALSHGDCIYISDTAAYVIDQSPEDCFLITLDGAKEAAWIGWMIGNLHFKASFSNEGVLVQDDLAVRQMLDRERIPYQQVSRVFQPSKQGGHSHDHDHSHDFSSGKFVRL
ncbi:MULTISPECIES: urease accessory protein UreE [unclassified Lentimonas]|uniref:urease accessory protein UreE n=1 Tax=unclassified Lentimonas TaxID=2630993 RepID=UPI001328626D|nr:MULTISPECIES: urease accessory protein UreE [unclassified Lentimonas]CAA6678971.1 Urease accessory protein UreE [Lentimonas sp. CC4]CAA6685124.1 Urease accessory protein UreE [Lentimonas sp. CC6]CAA7075150.1 Urease accessory protein UreE [Lentimonas sp. CC4]CAA7168390.1 Urease accessory protein UreE [Lentimonas sp. CC21]CAA7179995.1 Urease accessory protein UreE [Lentimonas sp. CC8]